MIFRVGIENNNDGFRSVAWTLEHPGCYAYGTDGDSALAALPAAVCAYADWIARHEASWIVADNIELHVDSTWTNYDMDENFVRVEGGAYTAESWFDHDWKPLSADDIARGLKLLSWSRADLLAVASGLSTGQLNEKKPGERWPIAGILNHVGGAEWWYLDRLGLAFPRQKLPKAPFERLEKVRALMNRVLPTLEGSKQVVGVEGEFWSSRKVLRRAVWHERDHTGHIQKLL